MGSIELTMREFLSQEAQNSTEGVRETQSFCKKINKPTLNLKVHEARTLRNQGHFDKAMLNITEANRDQVIAIRKIQTLMGRVRGERYPEVVFEKFRQFEPFEMGVSDADAALSILADIDDGDDTQLKDHSLKLHNCELEKKDEERYLSFLEGRLDDGTASVEVENTKRKVDSLVQMLMEVRNSILKKICFVVDEALKEMPPGIEKDRTFLELSQNIYLVKTSPILTKPATHVETET